MLRQPYLQKPDLCPNLATATNMSDSFYQVVLYALGGGVAGAVIAWSIHASIARRRVTRLTNEARSKIADITGQRDALADKGARSQAKIKKLRAANARRSSELRSVIKKTKLLARNVLTLRTERENTKIKLSTIQNALDSVRRQSKALQTEFDKTREFYKRELLKSLEKRKAVEEELRRARSERETLATLVESATSEHGSPENMLTAAQLRLGQLDVLERNVSKLEIENEQLRRDAVQIKKKFDARERDLRELEELRLHNRQLVQAVEGLEGSRQEYEADAERYREQADESEKESDTLRLKLEDLERNFADIEKQQNNALEDARKATVVPIARKQS